MALDDPDLSGNMLTEFKSKAIGCWFPDLYWQGTYWKRDRNDRHGSGRQYRARQRGRKVLLQRHRRGVHTKRGRCAGAVTQGVPVEGWRRRRLWYHAAPAGANDAGVV